MSRRSVRRHRLLRAHLGWQRVGRHMHGDIWEHTPTHTRILVWKDLA